MRCGPHGRGDRHADDVPWRPWCVGDLEGVAAAGYADRSATRQDEFRGLAEHDVSRVDAHPTTVCFHDRLDLSPTPQPWRRPWGEQARERRHGGGIVARARFEIDADRGG